MKISKIVVILASIFAFLGASLISPEPTHAKQAYGAKLRITGGYLVAEGTCIYDTKQDMRILIFIKRKSQLSIGDKWYRVVASGAKDFGTVPANKTKALQVTGQKVPKHMDLYDWKAWVHCQYWARIKGTKVYTWHEAGQARSNTI